MNLYKNLKNILLIALVVFSVSCDKDNLTIKNSENILKFKTIEELNSYMDNSLKMNLNELKELELTRGFKSFGRICDEVYQNLNIDKLTTFEQIDLYVKNHSEYLYFQKDEEGVLVLESVMSNNPYRYVMNKEKLFIINDRVVKVFENYLVATNIENMEELKLLNENNINTKSLDKKFEMFSEIIVKDNLLEKDATYNCGSDQKEARVTTNNDRTKISMNFMTQTQINNGTTWTQLCVEWEVRPYKQILGVWCYCTRTLLWDFNVRADYSVSGIWDHNQFHTYGSTIDPEWSIGAIQVISATTGSFSGYHFGGYKCYGRSLSNNGINASMTCNPQIF